MSGHFTVEVDFTDRTVRDGAFDVRTVVATVLANGDSEATLVAAQIVAATIHQDSMVTATRITGVVV